MIPTATATATAELPAGLAQAAPAAQGAAVLCLANRGLHLVWPRPRHLQLLRRDATGHVRPVFDLSAPGRSGLDIPCCAHPFDGPRA